MKQFIKGQKTKLTNITPATTLDVGVQLTFATRQTVDISCFGVDANNQLSDDRYLIFYNQKRSPEGSLSMKGAQGGDNERFTIDLSRLPQAIRKLVFTATLDSAGTMAQLRQGHLRLLANGIEVAKFAFTGADFNQENAIIIGELYLKGVWRFGAVGQGFNGGLNALLKSFGGEEIASEMKSWQRPGSKLSSQSSPSGKINLGKVTLKKKGDSTLLKSTRTKPFSRMNIKLKWTAAVDLDLHAFYKLRGGEFGHVYFGRKGDLDKPPHIRLDQDAGVGNTAGDNEENITISTLKNVEYILISTNIFRIFGFLSAGDNFAKYDGSVLIQTDIGDDIEVPLISEEPGRWCVIAKLDNTNPSSPRVININRVQKNKPSLNDYH